MRGFERIATRGNKKCGLCLYFTLPRGISINIVPKVGIFPGPKAEVNIHNQGCNIIDIPQGRVEYLFYYIGYVYTTVQTYLKTKAAVILDS